MVSSRLPPPREPRSSPRLRRVMQRPRAKAPRRAKAVKDAKGVVVVAVVVVVVGAIVGIVTKRRWAPPPNAQRLRRLTSRGRTARRRSPRP